MTDFQAWCEKLLPIVQAGAAGKVIEWQFPGDPSWETLGDNFSFIPEEIYRIKAENIQINGFVVPAPITNLPDDGTTVFLPNMYMKTFVQRLKFVEHLHEHLAKRNVLHLNKDAAIAHAKAMLGINPDKEIV